MNIKKEFQFNDNKMRSFVGKELKIKYDGKDSQGRVDDFYSDGSNSGSNNGLIMENEDFTLLTITLINKYLIHTFYHYEHKKIHPPENTLKLSR